MNSTALPMDNPDTGNSDAKASAAALATSTGAVLACSACCVLPIALPAVALALGATTLAWMKAAHIGLTIASLLMLAGAWHYTRRQSARSGKRTATATRVMLGGATLFTGVALGWYWIEPVLIGLFKG